MALQHAKSGDITKLELGEQISAAKSSAIFKSTDLEVMRLIFPAGHTMPAHQVAGEITIQCLEGEIQITAEGKTQELKAGYLIYIGRNISHELTAKTASSVLVTIALNKS